MKKILLLKTFLALLLALGLSFTYTVMPKAFSSLDSRVRDFMFIIRGELPQSNQVVIVDIDEKALNEHGQWPWSRDVVAELIYKLTDAGAGIIGLDIVFAEEDARSPHKLAQQFPSISMKLPNTDAIFATCLGQTPVVGGYFFTFEKTKEQNTPLIPAVFIQRGLEQENYILKPEGVVLNHELLQDSLYSSGFFNNLPDEGGMIRSVPLIMSYDGMLYPSLSLEMIRIYSGASKVEVLGNQLNVEAIKFGDFTIPTDHLGRLLINFRGPGRHFKYVSAADILRGDFDTTDIQNKFVLVGTSAVGLFDLRSIPFDNVIPGVEVHANAIDNILSGDFLNQPAETYLYDLIIIWSIVIVLALLFSIVRSLYIAPLAIVIFYGMFEFFFNVMFSAGIILTILFPIIAFVLTLIMSVGVDYIVASRQKEEAKRLLGKKVSPAVMDYLIEHSNEDLVASREVETTIFFSDIRGFTSISEKIGSPDRLIHLLNDYMTPMVDNVVMHHGTIDKFIGDAIMAYWNAPMPVANHADEALKSAIEQIEMLEEINSFVEPKYDVNIQIGIGIHTGIVTAGDMGSDGRSDYTIIGDNVNLASRLEGLTKQYAAQILISHATLDILTQEYRIRPIDLVEVKGKHEAVEIFEVLCSNKVVTDEELGIYNEAIKYFRGGEVKKAYELFSQLQKLSSCVLYEFYIKRCKTFLENPELEFTPILKMTTK